MNKEEKYKKMMERNALYAEDFRKGMTVTQIQRKYGVKSDSIVRHALKKEGLWTPKRYEKKDKPIDVPKVLALLAANWSMNEIVSEFGHVYTKEQIEDAVAEYREAMA